MVSEAQQNQIFGADIVCSECGVPKAPDAFNEASAVCKGCTPKVIRRQEVVITPEEHHQNEFTAQLRELRKTSEPQIVNGIQKALDLLGESPQEIAAQCIIELKNPGQGRSDLSPEQIAALPKDYKTIGAFTRMLQEAQIIHDKDLDGSNNPFEDMTPEQLRATMLQGAIDHAERNRELRIKLIRAFADRCPSFFEEVTEVAQSLAEVAA
ncbi:MAG: hypothetical protein GY826_11680 [Fuerstiella sp.]|jgi:hypothetical protein|nr:hypothetical protein [Fuerstiella sp.]